MKKTYVPPSSVQIYRGDDRETLVLYSSKRSLFSGPSDKEQRIWLEKEILQGNLAHGQSEFTVQIPRAQFLGMRVTCPFPDLQSEIARVMDTFDDDEFVGVLLYRPPFTTHDMYARVTYDTTV